MPKYTCSEYRQEMILAGLKRQLAKPDIPPEQRQKLEDQVRQLEKEMDLA